MHGRIDAGVSWQDIARVNRITRGRHRHTFQNHILRQADLDVRALRTRGIAKEEAIRTVANRIITWRQKRGDERKQALKLALRELCKCSHGILEEEDAAEFAYDASDRIAQEIAEMQIAANEIVRYPHPGFITIET